MQRIASRFAAGLLVAALVAPTHARADAESGFGATSGGGPAAEDESFKTELFSGAATSSVPFLLPPGANGFEPELGLRYDSQAGNGWLGRGWQLATPAVERMTKYGAPSFRDDPATGDAFALSDDRLVRDDAGFYHATRENFARIERVDVGGVAAHWVVHRSNGETQWFGASPDAKVVDAQGRILRWLLSRAEDANGNYIRYWYASPAETGDDGSAYLKQITYSFAGDESLASPTIRSVDFSLAPRPDPTIAYRAGMRIAMSRRLAVVQASYGGQRVSRYELVYADEEGAAPANGASLLRRVRRLGASGTATLPSDTFHYSGATPPGWTLDPGLGAALQSLTLGAGAELEHPNLANGSWLIRDVNGDGAPDVIGAKSAGQGSPFYQNVYLNDRSATAFRNVEIPIGGVLDLPANPGNEGVRLTDYDGDGKLDVLYWLFTPAVNDYAVLWNDHYVWIDEPWQGFYPPVPMAQLCSQGSIVGWTEVVDVDGNGYPDLVHDEIPAGCSGPRTTRQVYLNFGAGWPDQPDPAWSSALAAAMTALGAQAVWELFFFDLNGDGLLDVARDATGDGVLDSPTVLLNTQQAWVADAGFAIPAGFRPVDLDGDDLPDHAGANAQLNRGTALQSASFPLPAGFGAYAAGNRFVDIDGDGLVDLVQADGTTTQVLRANAAAPDNLLVRIERGIGAIVDIAHQSSTAGSCYSPAPPGYDFDGSGCHADPLIALAPGGSLANCSYPFVAWGSVAGSALCMMPFELLPFPVQTVASVTVDDRAGNVRTDRVRFTHGLYDSWEREFRGFGRTIERPETLSYTDPKQGGTVSLALLRITQFYQHAFLRGVIAALDLWSSADDQLGPGDFLLERTLNAYAFTRGDLPSTQLLLGDAIAVTGNALSCDPQVAQADPDCSRFELESDPYAAAIALPSPLPYPRFRSAFCDATPANRDCGFAYLVLPVATQTMRYDQSAPTLHAVTRWHDAHGNVQAEWDRGDVADENDDRVTIRSFAAPAAGAPPGFFAAPSRTWRRSVTGVVLADTRIDYDGLPNGQVRKGRVTAIVQDLDDPVQGITNSTVTTTATYADIDAGLPTAVSDPFTPGETPRYTTYGYTAGKSFVATTTRGALVTATTYDPAGAPPGLGIVRFVDDANGNRMTYGADLFGRPTFTNLPPEGGSGPRTLELNVYFDDPGWVTTPRVRTSTFDGSGNEVQVRRFTDGLGRVTRITTTGLDESDAPTTIRSDTRYDALGRVVYQERPTSGGASSGTAFYYDLRGRTRYVVQPDGGVQETVYDGPWTREIDAAGNRSDSLRDGAGSVTQVIQYPTASGPAQATRYVYDPLGRLVLVCDPLATGCGFVAGGGLPAAADPKHSVLIGYDTLSRRVRLVDPDRGEERFRYDGAGNLTRRTDARGKSVDYVYDALGRLISARSGALYTNEVAAALTYGDQLPESTRPPNSMGRVAIASDGSIERHRTEYEYDSVGRVTREAHRFLWSVPLPGGARLSEPFAIAYGYDFTGRVTSTAYPDGEVVTNGYDLMGLDRVASAQRSYVADIRHDAEGRPRSVSYGNGNVRTLRYDPASGHLIGLSARRTGAATDFMSFGYGYDLAARVTSITDLLTPSETLSDIRYDGISRLTQLVRNGQTLTYGYDALGNLTRKDGATQRFEHPTKPHALYEAASPTRFQYDASGNLVMRDGRSLGYDALGRLEQHDDPTTTRSVRYAYDLAGERTIREAGADVAGWIGPDYEIKNRVRWVKTIRAEGVIVAQVTGMLPSQAALAPWLRGAPIDPAPLVLATAGAALLAALASALRRSDLVSPGRRGVAAGLVVVVVTAPALPALAARKGDVKADGSLTLSDSLLVLRSLAGQLTLTTTQRADADVTPLANGEPVGDGRVDAGDGQVLFQAATGVDVDGDGLGGADEARSGTWPIDRDSDGDGVADGLDDTDADGATNAVEAAQGTPPMDPDGDDDGWVDGDDPLPLVAAGTLVAYVHTDHLGSSAVLTDATGAVVRRTRYQAFGEVRSNVLGSGAPATTLDPAQKFTGQQLDSDTALVYYGARWYDPRFGRFASPDSIVPDPLDPQTLNRYAYTRNDPLRRVDPTGHFFDWFSSWWSGGDDFELSFHDEPDWDVFGGYDFSDWGWSSGGWSYSFDSSGYAMFDSAGGSAWKWSFSESLYGGDASPDWFAAVESESLLRADAQEVQWRTPANLAILESLDPYVANLAAAHLHAMAAEGIDARMTYGYRSYEIQDSMYAQGRTAPGPVVTNASGGMSWHNFRLAYDIAIFDERGQYISDGADSRYGRAGQLAEGVGLEWGGRWQNPDASHFQFTGGLPIRTVRERWEKGVDVFP